MKQKWMIYMKLIELISHYFQMMNLILYSNINDNEKETFKAIEVKLNMRKMKGFVAQLKKDFKVLGKIINQKADFIGIINSNSSLLIMRNM